MATQEACPEPTRGSSRKNELKKEFSERLSALKKEANLILSLKGQADTLKKGEYFLIQFEGHEPFAITRKTVRALQTAHNKRYSELKTLFADIT